MKKRITVKKLNRSFNQRKTLFKSLLVALVKNEEITTTKAKAQAVKSMADKLITKAKIGSLHATRQIQSFIQDKETVKKLVSDVAKRFSGTKGGYTTITPIGTRRGDNASMVKLSLSKMTENKPIKKEAKKEPKKETKKPDSRKPLTPQADKIDEPTPLTPVKQRIRKVQKKG